MDLSFIFLIIGLRRFELVGFRLCLTNWMTDGRFDPFIKYFYKFRGIFEFA